MTKKFLLIISVSAGAGHVRAAEALRKTAERYFPQYAVQHIDMMDYVSRAMRAAITDAYDLLVRSAPFLWRAIYDVADQETRMKHFYKVLQSVNRVSGRKFYKKVEELRPDHIICTHSFPAQVLRQSSDEYHRTVPLSLVVTDYDIHRFWLVKNVSEYFCATEKAAAKLRSAGMERVHVTGIPVDPVFYEQKDTAALRREMNIPENAPVVLMLSGGMGAVRLDEIMEELSRKLGTEMPYVIAVAGKNKKLHAALIKIAAALPDPTKLQAIGWTDRVDEYMRIADVVVTKSGGITTSECMVLGKPMIIIQPIPGQEERNAEYLLEQGTAVVARSTEDLLYYISQHKKQAPREMPAIENSAAYRILASLYLT